MRYAILIPALVLCSVLHVTAREDSSSDREMHRLYLEDQRDRGVGGESLPWEKLETRDQARRARVQELLESGQLKTAEDFHDAAFIYQHGQSADDYLLAHVLAMVAVQKGDSKSLWISAATLDRYLRMIGQPQVFGTQYENHDDSPFTQQPYNRNLVPDQLRAVFCVPAVEQQQKNLTVFNAGKYPSEIIPPGCTR
jgi:hypothetical protein